ncbi:unnamed protein product, partial [Gongylonema pulchrum]|uniref:DUF4201 domain-containing protein n=1 Tax=Gongylonema pulchrum TaxID=637853 RepID=A0A183DC43_9BILA
MDLVKERDQKDEGTDKLSIYRHQASAVSRKKATLVEKLQEARAELQNLESAIEAKKNEFQEKAGTDFVITSVQFKNYVNKLRNKTYSYKRKRAEIDDLKSEESILARTVDILSNQWKTMKQKIEESGGKIIETTGTSDRPERVKTAKPKTDDVRELRDMINELNQKLDSKRTTINELNQTNNELNEQLAV